MKSALPVSVRITLIKKKKDNPEHLPNLQNENDESTQKCG